MSKKTDLLYGRRGGYFAPDNYTPTDIAGAPVCDVCGSPMIVGQRQSHFICDPDSMVGKRCACPAGCTTELVGDGVCCDLDCVPCRLNANRLHREVVEWARCKS